MPCLYPARRSRPGRVPPSSRPVAVTRSRSECRPIDRARIPSTRLLSDPDPKAHQPSPATHGAKGPDVTREADPTASSAPLRPCRDAPLLGETKQRPDRTSQTYAKVGRVLRSPAGRCAAVTDPGPARTGNPARCASRACQVINSASRASHRPGFPARRPPSCLPPPAPAPPPASTSGPLERTTVSTSPAATT